MLARNLTCDPWSLGVFARSNPDQRSGRAERRLGLAMMLMACLTGTRAHAQDDPDAQSGADLMPHTFSYAEPPTQNRVRASLEIAGVMTVGFLYYVSTNAFLEQNFDTNYSWPVFRSKLLGEAFGLDVNGLNTNFVGHPLGGSMYYSMARTNHLSVPESFAFAILGSTFWEFFGEVSEEVSTNDMIVTPLAGVGIAEPMIQLGAFFDRSSPSLRNRVLGTLLAPFKALNDFFDGATLARAQQVDEHGFPLNEWHQFDLSLGVVSTLQGPSPATATNIRSHELRMGLGSQLARLPDYDGAGQHSLFFGDANVSSMRVAAAITQQGLVDLDIQTRLAVAGYFYRHARRNSAGQLHGHGLLIGLTMG